VERSLPATAVPRLSVDERLAVIWVWATPGRFPATSPPVGGLAYDHLVIKVSQIGITTDLSSQADGVIRRRVAPEGSAFADAVPSGLLAEPSGTPDAYTAIGSHVRVGLPAEPASHAQRIAVVRSVDQDFRSSAGRVQMWCSVLMGRGWEVARLFDTRRPLRIPPSP
jgi:hypothetical protein